MVEIHWTRAAQEAVKNIAIYISKDSAFYAEKQVQKFFESVRFYINTLKLASQLLNTTERIYGRY